ncbi:MAG: hypothetical protein IJ057_04375 [Bacteroidales bacterium]|nr:hypothetical protein [Bacteroidales bacterium]
MKKTIRRIAPVAIVLLGLTTLSFTAKDGITLKLQPQKGKHYTINVKNTSMNIMEVMGQTQNQSQTIETRQTFTVKEVDASQSTLETQIEAIKMNIGASGMKLEYDSEHPEKTSPMLASQTSEFDKILNKPATVVYNAQGEFVGDATDLDMNQLSTVIIKLPAEELSVGSKWTNEKTQNMSGSEFKVSVEYTVTSISKKSVEVCYSGKIEADDDTTGNVTGTASINPQTGLVTTRSEKQNISTTISQQGLSIPMTMAANTTVTVTEK